MRLIHFLMPHHCVLCGNISKSTQDLCIACYNELPILTHSCPQCAREIEANLICGTCINHPPPYDATYSLFRYEFPITHLILTLKFHQALVYGKILGELLAAKIRDDWYAARPLPDIIIPMPLHKKRLKERGFNQAIEIARPIAQQLHLPMDIYSCLRVKSTSAQAKLSSTQRKKNLRNAFEIYGNFQGKYIAVLDDVITTGSTVVEFSNQLKKSGAVRIDIWSCARTMI